MVQRTTVNLRTGGCTAAQDVASPARESTDGKSLATQPLPHQHFGWWVMRTGNEEGLRTGHPQEDDGGLRHPAGGAGGRHLRTMTRDILERVDWLSEMRVRHVVIESTSVCWKPLQACSKDAHSS